LEFEICTVRKLDHAGRLVTSYQGQVIRRDQTSIVLEARWTRDRLALPYIVFERGDRLIEFFFADRWYSIFELHAGVDNRLKGWYCNVSRPAMFEDDSLSAIDLELDLFVYPSGETLLLDEDEFEALNLQQVEPESWKQVQAAIAELRARVATRRAPFDVINEQVTSDTER
jgi:predicted RNA-binding protein associated with RNAse of E/G family